MPKKYLNLILLFLVIFETLVVTNFAGLKSNIYLSPWLILVTGMLICVTSAFIPENNQITFAPKSKKLFQIGSYSVFALCAIYIAYLLNPIFVANPPDPSQSDIIPAINYYVTRFLNHEPVYAPMPMGGWDVIPNYMPLSWLPFIFSALLEIDYRWTAYIMFVIAIFLHFNTSLKTASNVFDISIKLFIPFILIFLIIDFKDGTFAHTVELNIVAMYLFLALSLQYKNNVILTLGILCCLMSRFSFTFWMPACILMIWIAYNFKKAFGVSAGIIVGVLLLYIVPFVFFDEANFFSAMGYYKTAILDEWKVQFWQNPNDIPYHLAQGNGIAIYFYNIPNLALEARYALFQSVQLPFLIILSGLLVILYFKIRKSISFYKYAILSLKFYLIFFYLFVPVPYTYLYMVPIFLNVPILYMHKFTFENKLNNLRGTA